MSVKFRWLGYVCFEIVLPSGKVIVTDPFIDYSHTAPIKSREITGADYIAVTHGHFDHTTDVGELAKKYNSKVVCSYQVAEPLIKFFDLDPNNIIKVTAGSELAFDDLKIEVTRSEHINGEVAVRASYERVTGKTAGPDLSMIEMRKAMNSFNKSIDEDQALAEREIREKMQSAGFSGGEQLGFIFQTSDNLRLYFYTAGIHEYLYKQIAEAHPNVILVQLGGCDPEKAAEVAALSGAEIVIPTHHDGDGLEIMHELAHEMGRHLSSRSKAHFVDIEIGEWYEIGVEISLI